MSCKLPPEESPPCLEYLRLQAEVLQFACKLVTPLYGGGVVAGTVDENMPIRATALRGQLRFWWRVAHRRNFQGVDGQVDTKKMFAAERAIWGGLGNNGEDPVKSRVTLRTADVSLPFRPEAAAEYHVKKDGGYPTFPTWKSWAGGKAGGYALFPAQGKASKQGVEVPPAKLLKPGAYWTLEIVFDGELEAEKRRQVETALRWWATFGGLGARTRRGLGAVEVHDMQGRLLAPVSRAEAETAGCVLQLGQAQHKDAGNAWMAGIEALQMFRQGEKIGRNPGKEGRPGRSRWPEPDAVRRLTKKNSPQHAPEHKAGIVFPRAHFGLPIVMPFKDKKAGDPADANIKPPHAERMASPLLLRPYRTQEGWHPAALALPRDHLNNLKVVLGRGEAEPSWPRDPREQRRLAELIPPMQGRGDDPITAFLHFFAEKNGARPSVSGPAASPVFPQQQETRRLEGVQIKYNPRNGSLELKAKDGKSIFAIGDEAQRLWDSLPDSVRGRIRGGAYVRGNATVRGNEVETLEVAS